MENVCTKSNPVIDPNDILFVVGEDKSACCCSEVGIIPASDSDTAIYPACLDLSSFRGMNGKTITDPEVIKDINNFSQMQVISLLATDTTTSTTTPLLRGALYKPGH